MGPIATIMIPIMLVVLIVGTALHIKEWARLRNGCGKHAWDFHDNGNTIHQYRICLKCEIQQFRLDYGYAWGANRPTGG